ncbi:MAG: hypothetical protein PHV02_02855 [Rhodocyclaceae bacterium]|nr:hypothetical protein [Rhodocyclaceae bacterium]
MTLAPVFLGSLVRRRMATLFSLLAIILGVALGMAVQAIHEAALNEFGRGVRVLAGAADLRLVGPASGFDERLLEQILQHPEIVVATPIVEVEAKLAGHEQLLKILGVDIFTLARVAPRLLPQSHDKSDRFAALAEDSIFLSAAAQEAYAVKIGEQLTVQDGSRAFKLRVAGDLPGVADGQRLAVMDIAGAQLAFGRIGKLSRIDLIVAGSSSPESLRSSLQGNLPAGVLLEAPEAASEQSGNLTRAYRVNLSMLAAIALLTGAFLVFSAQALSVVKRRSEFAFLRALGLERATLIHRCRARLRFGLGGAAIARWRSRRWLFFRAATATGIQTGTDRLVCFSRATGRAGGRCLTGPAGSRYFAGASPQIIRRCIVDQWSSATVAGLVGPRIEPGGLLHSAAGRSAAGWLCGHRIFAGWQHFAAPGHRPSPDATARRTRHLGGLALGGGTSGQRARLRRGRRCRRFDQRCFGCGDGDHGRLVP